MTARLTIAPDLFDVLLAGLAERGQGNRESGAFLLTDRTHPEEELPQPVTAIAFYDDLDPDCLTGRIDFHAAGYTALQDLCRRDGLRVVGDIHTHPAHRVQQSRVDATHPMVARDGHVALIAPHFAAGVTDVSQLGVHLRVKGTWASFYREQAAELLLVPAGRLAAQRTPWWRRMLSRFRRRQRQERR
ncbi:hypothetical protein [Micromonospora halophytica]|uniref:Prokaryotic homologs of the JAB domain n=1 Tax=Micromonospora halophytica TaxID=47864 RepID=A0A1C5INY9_9ACTN|nr:hypothetical protein [Micromonospora halophytica]SCG60038.1 Prokaryotic homologs of the JAB domain [Micromonospora halophytica]